MYVPCENIGVSESMKIEAVIICKDYSDFLKHTLSSNMNHLDRIIVVTHPNDKKTQALCNHYSVDFIDTTVFHDNGDRFNKGRAINLGLSHLRHEDWLLHIDADVLLPHDFRRRLYDAKLNKSNIYGVDRLNVGSYENWMAHKEKIEPQHKYRFLVDAIKEFPMGSRLLHREYGYVPIGFFQLFHSSAHRKYPIIAGSAEHSDVLFGIQWAREHRILLPELFVFHLESDNSKFGANWQGRTTKEFK